MRPKPTLMIVVRTLILVGIVGSVLFRISPLFLGDDAVRWQFIGDDGYYALAVARNLAAGHGLSVDGASLTSGFQPASVFLFSGAFRMADGDRNVGLRYIIVLQVIVSLLAVAALLSLILPMLKEPYRRPAALLIAFFWLCSPRVYLAEMSGMETGLYIAALAYASALYLRERAGRAPGTWGFRPCFGIGCILAIVFFVRNDGVFLSIAVITWHILTGNPRRSAAYEAVFIGAIALVAVSPWLLYNFWLSGSIVPTSGHAEVLGARLAGNLQRSIEIVLEMPLLVTKSPVRRDVLGSIVGIDVWWLFPVSGVILIGGILLGHRRAGYIFRIVWRQDTIRNVKFALLYLVFLFLFYAFFFGAQWHLDRFLLPVQVPVVAVVAAHLSYLWRFEKRGAPQLCLGFVIVAASVVSGAHFYYTAMKVEWLPSFPQKQCRVVENHHLQGLALGAMNSGALGFYYDDVINLDGKVNGEALAARRVGKLGEYIVDSAIDAIVDLNSSIVELWRDEALRAHFDLIEEGSPGGIGLAIRKTPECSRNM